MTVELFAESSRNPALRMQRLKENRKMQEIITDVVKAEQSAKFLNAREVKEIALGAIALYNGLDMLRILGYTEKEIENAWTRSIFSMITRARLRPETKIERYDT